MSSQVSGEQSQVSGQPGFQKLQVWQAAHKLARSVYLATDSFPGHEIFGLTSQLRRAALAVPTNIVEGQSTFSKKEFRRFLRIANASLVETEYLLLFAQEVGYLKKDEYDNLLEQQSHTGRLLQGLIRSLHASLDT